MAAFAPVPRLLVSFLLCFLCVLVVAEPESAEYVFASEDSLLQAVLTGNQTIAERCEEACERLQEILPQRSFDGEEPTFFKKQDFFWSNQQAEDVPKCYLQPTSAQEVSTILRIVQQTQCHFAVKSGGHAAFSGASNARDGVTIDLSLLNELSLSDDEAILRLGAGNRWGDVYAYLDPKRLSVVGGRVTEVGVGGLLLGGGLSFLSGRHGWAMDNVRNYQLVIASGEVLDVNLESYPELFWALRGGGNNFGIVTRFDLETVPLEGMWGGRHINNMSLNRTVISHFVDFAAHSSSDVDAQLYTGFVWVGRWHTWIISSEYTHVQPESIEAGMFKIGEGEAEREWPRIFSNFSALPNIQSTVRRSNMSDLTTEVNVDCPNGFRNTYWTWTMHLDESLTQAVIDLAAEAFVPLQHMPEVVVALVLQHVTPSTIAGFQRNGGNANGIQDGDGPLVIAVVSVMWSDPTDDDLVMDLSRNYVQRATDEARKKNLHHRYMYQNYAAHEQRVFESYGEPNLERLRGISRQYDPDQVFQRLQPGYFKLYPPMQSHD